MQFVLRIFNHDEMTRLKKLHNESLHKFYSSIINHHHHWLDSPTWALAFPQKLLAAEVSGYCFLRFGNKSLFLGEVVRPTPNPQLSWRAYVFCQDCLP
jgi:hypothetical protein